MRWVMDQVLNIRARGHAEFYRLSGHFLLLQASLTCFSWRIHGHDAFRTLTFLIHIPQFLDLALRLALKNLLNSQILVLASNYRAIFLDCILDQVNVIKSLGGDVSHLVLLHVQLVQLAFVPRDVLLKI